MNNLSPVTLDEFGKGLEDSCRYSSPFRDFCTNNLSPIRIDHFFVAEGSPRPAREQHSEKYAHGEAEAFAVLEHEQHGEQATGHAEPPMLVQQDLHRVSGEERALGRGAEDGKEAFLVEPPRVFEPRSRALSMPEPQIAVARRSSTSTSATTCNCRRSRCLKLYCDCFANGRTCHSDCRCENCRNNAENEAERNEAIKVVRDRLPNAFSPSNAGDEPSHFCVVDLHPRKQSDVLKVKKGCNCRRSGCLKRYCECYEAGRVCGAGCSCDNCRNKAESGFGEAKQLRKAIAKQIRAGTLARSGKKAVRAGKKPPKRELEQPPNEEIFLP